MCPTGKGCSKRGSAKKPEQEVYRQFTAKTKRHRLKRFGLDGDKPKILEEVGKKFGVTREGIRQLQNIALAKLRRALAKREKPIVRRDPIQILKD